MKGTRQLGGERRRRNKVVGALDTLCKRIKTHYVRLEAPDRAFELLETTMRDAGHEVFATKTIRDAWREVLKAHRRDLLSRRQELRLRRGNSTDVEEETLRKELVQLPNHAR